MRTKIKILLYINLSIFILLSLSGCWGSREINDLQIVVGMGVDNSKTPGNVYITAQIVKPGEISNPTTEAGGARSKAFWDVNSTGRTIFEAVRNITQKTGKRLFVSHSQIVIFGKDLASETIQEHIDFFLRSHEMRPTTLILISKDTAEEILDTKPEKELLPSMQILKIVKSYGFSSQFLEVNLQDFSSRLMSKTTSPIAPLIEVEVEKETTDFRVSGMAVFKNAKMTGTLSPIESRGLLWVLGKVKSGTVVINTPDKEGEATLEILKSQTKVTPEIKDKKISMNIEIKVDASLAEQTSIENLATVPAFEKMQKELEDAIYQEIVSSFEKSKDLNADIFGFGDIIHKKYRNTWQQLEKKWDTTYPSIKLDISIEAKLRKTDLLTKPAAPEKEEEK